MYTFRPKEINLLALLCEGKALKEAAPLVNRSYESAKEVMYTCRQRLHIRTTFQLIAIFTEERISLCS